MRILTGASTNLIAFLNNNDVLLKPTAFFPKYVYFKTLKLKKERDILLFFLKRKPEQILLQQRYQVSQSVGSEQNRTELSQLDSSERLSLSIPCLGTGVPQDTHEKLPSSLADRVYGGCNCWKPYNSNCCKLRENPWHKIMWSSKLSKTLLVYYWSHLSLSS